MPQRVNIRLANDTFDRPRPFEIPRRLDNNGANLSRSTFLQLFSMQYVVLLADEKTSAWLTPVWLLSIALAIGLGLYLLLLLMAFLGSWVPGINRLYDRPQTRWTAGAILSAILIALGIGASFWAGWWSPDTSWTEVGTQETPAEKAVQLGNATVLWAVLGTLFGLLLGFGTVALVSARRRTEVLGGAREGALFWLGCVCSGGVLFLFVGWLLSATGGLGIMTVVDQPQPFFRSISRIFSTGLQTAAAQIPIAGPTDAGFPLEVAFQGDEFRWIQFDTDQPVKIAFEPITSELALNKFYPNVAEMTSPLFTPVSGEQTTPIPRGAVDTMYVLNLGDAPANFRVRWQTQPPVPQIILVVALGVFVAATFLVLLLLTGMAPKTSAIALATFKTEVSQPIFLILTVIGLIAILLSIYVPYYTLGEDIKMFKESGLTLIRVMGIFLATWAASKSVAEEIEGRTALTVLSKPIGRTQFVLGKYFGIAMAVGCLFLVLGVWFFIWTSYKPVYDTVESSALDFNWEISFAEAFSILPGLMLAFLECLIFVAISVAISTRVGILPAFLLTFSIYVLGHLTPNLVLSNVGQIEQVRFVGSVITILLPVLDHFDATTAVMTNAVVPLDYLGWAAIYCLLYSSIMLLLGLVFFQDRDLA